MRRFAWFSLAAGLLLAVAACSSPDGNLRGATPAGYVRPVANPALEETADPIDLADLLETPETYEGQVFVVSGTFYQRQVVVCTTRPQRSPAGWALSDGEERIPAGGTNDLLDGLPSGRVEITVIGRWVRWQGPVGCGRQAQVTEVWHLEVLDVLSPNPITIAAVGTTEGGITNQSEPPETEGGYPGPETGDEQITVTPVISGTTQPELPEPGGTPVIGSPPTPTPTGGIGSNPPASPTKQTAGVTRTPTPSPEAEETTPTATSSAETPSPTTTTGGSPAPTTTGGGGETETVDQEDLPPGSIETAQLNTGEVHRWPFVITSTAVITINIASQMDLDAVITLQDPSGNVVAQQNNAQDGAPEIMAAVPLTELGTYSILISGESETTGYYAILVLNDESYTFVFNGTIEFGQSESAELRADNDHFWHFFGTAGETVTIRVMPGDDSDLFIRLFGPSDTLIVDFHNETGEGEAEELLSFTLPDTGFYSILIGELNFGEANYTISLSSG